MRSKYWHTRERSNYRAVRDVNRTLASESTARLRALITSNRRHDTSVTPCVPGLSGQPCAFLKEGTWSRFPFVDYPSYHSGGHVGNKMSSGAAWRHTRALSPPVFAIPDCLSRLGPPFRLNQRFPAFLAADPFYVYKRDLDNDLLKYHANDMYVA